MPDEKSKFDRLLEAAGIRRAELGRRLGITPRQISRWGNSPPKYAVAYLELLAENQKAPRGEPGEA